MIRAKSAQSRVKQFVQAEALDEDLHHQIKKSNLLDGDRTDFWRHAEDIKQKNKQEIQKLRIENMKLKHMRDELTGAKKNGKNSFFPSTQITDQNYWRRQLDKEKHNTQSKKNMLLNLQGILEELQDNKIGMTEQSPLVKNIRVLENRLDKVMIKYNEAQSIRKTYEQISKRLKQQRIKYDNELASIQKTLKGKSHDYQQLLLLAHDATHAKELAEAQFKKFQMKKQSVDDLRTKFIKQKRGQLQLKKFVPKIQTMKEKKIQQKPQPRQTINYKEETNFQKQQLSDYQDAYRKLKQVTGVLDANQIIQKFKTQGLTTQQFERQKQEYKQKIIKLNQQYNDLKKQLDRRKFQQQKVQTKSNQSSLNEIQRLQYSINQIRNASQKLKVKRDRLDKILIDVKSGGKHISSNLDFYKIQHYSQGQTAQQNMLQVISQKIQSIYRVITNDPDYNANDFKQTPSNLQVYFQSQNHLFEAVKNVRLQRQLDDSISQDEFQQSIRLDDKAKRMDLIRIKK